MQGMVRIRAKAIQPPKSGLMLINGVLPTWCDVEFYVVGPDGKEVPLTGVKRMWMRAQESSEPITAILEVYVTEIDVMARAQLVERK